MNDANFIAQLKLKLMKANAEGLGDKGGEAENEVEKQNATLDVEKLNTEDQGDEAEDEVDKEGVKTSKEEKRIPK